MSSPLDLETIVANGLCIGCGLCQSLAGADKVCMVATPEGQERPLVAQPLDNDTLARINATCPGIRVVGPGTVIPGPEFESDLIWGPGARLVKGYAADPEIRFKGASGGVLTALSLHLLEAKLVDYVLHVAASRQQPVRARAHESTNRAQILEGAGSRYGPTTPLTDFRAALDRGRPFAYVGKPCDVAAVRNLARLDPRVGRLIPYVLTMVCGGTSEFRKWRDILSERGLAEDDLALFRFRGYGNPGLTRIETEDGRAFELTYNDLWEDEATWHDQFRCRICPDAIGEQADIAVFDVWPGGAPTGEDEGFNGLMARTPAGLALLDEAIEAGAITVTNELTFRDLDDFQPHQVRKKQGVHDRLRAMADAGVPVPVFEDLRLAEIAETVDVDQREADYRGMTERLARGAHREPPPKS
jgi:coenzyme F420 hydrogenase subunit beta